MMLFSMEASISNIFRRLLGAVYLAVGFKQIASNALLG